MPKILGVLLLALGVAAAQQPTSTQSVGGSKQPALPNNLQLRAALKTKLDSKKAKVGDKVKLAVLEEVRGSDNEVLLPKGTELRGRVTLAVPFKSVTAPARLSLVVDTAQLKSGPATMSAFVSGGVEMAIVEIVDAKRKTSDSAAGPQSVKCGVGAYNCNPKDVGQWDNGPDVSGAPVEETTTWTPAEKMGVDVRLSPDSGIVSELVSSKGDISLREETRLKLRNFVP
jgi:hypothetical protein